MDYQEYLESKEKRYEFLCRHCGACCGAYDDPCKHLKKDHRGVYFCDIYSTRFGLRETVGGEKFFCVPIREMLKSSWPKDYLCPYKNYYRV